MKVTIAMFREYNSLTRAIYTRAPEQNTENEEDPDLAVVTGLETRGA